MKGTLLLLSMLPLLTSGCLTLKMWSKGSATVTEPPVVITPPQAVKIADGSLAIPCTIRSYHLDVLADRKTPETLKVTNRIPIENLEQVDMLPYGKIQVSCPRASDHEPFVTPGQLIPILHLGPPTNGLIRLPDHECIIDQMDSVTWFWYVPPQQDGELGLATGLQVHGKEITKNSFATVPVKMALTPITFSTDVFASPLYAFILFYAYELRDIN